MRSTKDLVTIVNDVRSKSRQGTRAPTTPAKRHAIDLSDKKAAPESSLTPQPWEKKSTSVIAIKDLLNNDTAMDSDHPTRMSLTLNAKPGSQRPPKPSGSNYESVMNSIPGQKLRQSKVNVVTIPRLADEHAVDTSTPFEPSPSNNL